MADEVRSLGPTHPQGASGEAQQAGTRSFSACSNGCLNGVLKSRQGVSSQPCQCAPCAMQAYPDEVEERIVNEEYKVWKKNTPFLYGEHARPAPTSDRAVVACNPGRRSICMQDMYSLHCKSVQLHLMACTRPMTNHVPHCRPGHHPCAGVAQPHRAMAAGALGKGTAAAALTRHVQEPQQQRHSAHHSSGKRSQPGVSLTANVGAGRCALHLLTCNCNHPALDTEQGDSGGQGFFQAAHGAGHAHIRWGAELPDHCRGAAATGGL